MSSRSFALRAKKREPRADRTRLGKIFLKRPIEASGPLRDPREVPAFGFGWPSAVPDETHVNVSNSSAPSADQYAVSVAKMRLDDQRTQGEAATKLIDAAGDVAKRPNRGGQREGVGRRVDVSA